ncbi:MAG: 23S rRNA (uracil(1939)-C(5))-methyltransferase RlmD [Clostridia bacterium]|nr:23S rRNA (uracil(1939)-C(5))-methyltransferase RlmD [Clostridia bacterium]
MPGKPCDISITALTHDGRGVGRADGKAVFVPGLVPGDRALVRIVRRHASYAEGVTSELLERSPDRTAPFCPSYGACGGCSVQHLSYPAQLAWKRKLVTDALARIGGMADAEARTLPTIGMQEPFAYRHKVSMPVRPNGIGFFARDSHRAVPFAECRIQHPAGPALRTALQGWMERWEVPAYDDADRSGLVRHLVVRTSRSSGEVQAVLVLACAELEDGDGVPVLAGLPELTAELEAAAAGVGARLAGLTLNAQPEPGARILGDEWLCVHGHEDIEETLDGMVFRLSPASFFQVNPEQAEVLYRVAVDWATSGPEGAAAGPAPGRVVDLYCGTGTIACLLARRAERVVGIETEPAAVRDAAANAERNGLADRVSFVEGRAEDVLEAVLADIAAGGEAAPSAVVLDPPRRGCDPVLLDTLVRAQPDRIVYVSCDPATLARDVRRLATGGCRVDRAQPVDLFPWTEHVETVVLMSRVEK